jgi:transcriptional regulator with XRE-family HTH domain
MNKKFSSRLREARGSKSQAEFCALLDVKQGTYSTWELGKYEPPLGMITKIARVANVSPDWLLGVSTDPPLIEHHVCMADQKAGYLAECQECKKKQAHIDRLERIIDKLTN